ncbi:MAG: DUF1343 domain-containing protein [Pseudomonadota bacterium]
MKKFFLLFLMLFVNCAFGTPEQTVITGAEQTELYLPQLAGKKVAVFANNTSLVGKKHLVDVLLKNHIHITKIFVPEHGFRGNEEGGKHIHDSYDPRTGIRIVSLYGEKLKPTPEDLKNVDVIVFDVQDVGVRFYTYISSLQKIMEAAVDNNKPLIILDRPNPNGFYVDGPVLDPKFKSFTGLQPIPIVYGMTIGEYAKMLVGQEWLDVTPKSAAKTLALTIIPVRNYTHATLYVPPVRPSPNLPDIQSIYYYPSIGLMESTVMSVGRGTPRPFEMFGHPALRTNFGFKPVTMPATKHPPFENEICYGWDLRGSPKTILKRINNKLQIRYIMLAYKKFPDKDQFFGHSINRGMDKNNLPAQLADNMSEAAIRKSWEPKLTEFKEIRKKYLLYPDFS